MLAARKPSSMQLNTHILELPFPDNEAAAGQPMSNKVDLQSGYGGRAVSS